MTQYKLVPIEPTEQIIEIGFNSLIECGAENIDGYDVRFAYKAMLEAAPDVGGEAVAWMAYDGNQMREYYCVNPLYKNAIPLYTYPPDAAKRIAELEADKARLVEEITLTIEENLYLADGNDCTLHRLNKVLAEMGKELPSER